MDCGYPVCQTNPSRVGACGLYGKLPCNWTVLAAACDKTAGCEGFNGNGWLKNCLPPHCAAGKSGLEPGDNTDLLVKLGAPMPLPPPAPPAPVPDIQDSFYPAEEAAEEGAADVPLVVSVQGSTGCTLRTKAHPAALAVKVGDLAFGNWSVRAIVTSSSAPLVVLERRWKRWGLLVFSSAAGEVTRLRKPLGQLELTAQTEFSFKETDPTYFTKAANEPTDYIGSRIINESEVKKRSIAYTDPSRCV